jgi:DNA-binding transcriptional LysR family regulator
MNLRQLECFKATMDNGTVTRAAVLLGISQPAVSNMLAGLEHELGFALFERVNGRLRPTPEAQYLYEDVVRTLGSLERTTETARAIRHRTHGNLVVASYPGLAIDFLPLVVSTFLKGRPQVRIELYSRSSHVLHDLIPAQGFDIAIADLPATTTGVRTEPLALECLCVLPAGHPLEKHDLLTPELLSGVPFISLFKEHATHYSLASAFAAANAAWNVVVECRLFATCCALASRGTGVAVVDPITASEYAMRNVVVRPFVPAIRYEVALLFPTERLGSALLDDFVALLRERLGPFLAKPKTPAGAHAPPRRALGG